MSITNQPKALLTDVFGTVVDWRTTVNTFLADQATTALNSPTSSIPSTVRAVAAGISWPAFAQQWRESYYKFTRSYTPFATVPFKSVDQHHYDALVQLLAEHDLTGLYDQNELQKMSLIWHFLDPWPDSPIGLSLLNSQFETATLSNGNTSLLADLAAHGHLPYKHIVSAEDFGAYKPHPDVYLGAARKLGLEPTECALIAAHLGDLKAAKGCGYQTIYIERRQEETLGSEEVKRAKDEAWVDMWVGIDEPGFVEVARRFGIEQ